ncbi:MAG: hypothetical protein PSV22_06100 [Pseudolabrys sp.]|nr:hypothetical protein [Pseudolabrys sp.]
MIALGELIVPAKVVRLGDSPHLPILSKTMSEGLVDQSVKFNKRIASEDLSDYKVVSRGQLVVGFPIDEGVVGVQRLYDRAVVSPAYAVWNIDLNLVDADYLEAVLKHPRSLDYYRTKLRGSTARRRSIPRADFLALGFELPSKSDQLKIRAINELRSLHQLQARTLSALAISLVDSAWAKPLDP